MTPIQIDDMSFHKVIDLYCKVRRHQIREEDITEKLTDPNRKIMRPAGDDWF